MWPVAREFDMLALGAIIIPTLLKKSLGTNVTRSPNLAAVIAASHSQVEALSSYYLVKDIIFYYLKYQAIHHQADFLKHIFKPCLMHLIIIKLSEFSSTDGNSRFPLH